MGALIFLAGVAGLLVGGHFVVENAARIGARLGLTSTVVGLTIVAAGTSAPELAVVFQSMAADDTPLAVGSIIGSNIANVLLVLGLVATTGAIVVSSRIVRIDIPVMIAASAALLVMSLDQRLSRLNGLLLFSGVVVFVVWTLRASTGGGDPEDRRGEEIDRVYPWSKALAGLALGVAALALSARYVVSGAEAIAAALGVPELIIGLTVVALGTSAPEIVTTILAAMRGRRDLAVGNAVGSNIFNILLVLGFTSAVSSDGIAIGIDAVELDLPIMVAAAVACLPMVFWDNRLERWEGGIFVAYYLAYLAFLALDGSGNRASDPFAFVMMAFVIPLTAVTVLLVVMRRRKHLRGPKAVP